MCAMKSVLLVVFCVGMVVCDTAPYQASQAKQANSVDSSPYPVQNEVQYAPVSDEKAEKGYTISQQGYDTAVYDPSLYQGYAGQDAVQQYVTSYNGAGAPGNVGVIPYQGFPLYPNPGGGYSVQTGYEGYLVPSFPGPIMPPGPVPGGPFDVLRDMLPYPRTVFSAFTRSAGYLISAIGVVLFGGALTTGICTFTPLCSISFALPFLFPLRESAKKITDAIDLDADTSERVRRAADFVQAALEKYNKMQATLEASSTNSEKKTSD